METKLIMTIDEKKWCRIMDMDPATFDSEDALHDLAHGLALGVGEILTERSGNPNLIDNGVKVAVERNGKTIEVEVIIVPK